MTSDRAALFGGLSQPWQESDFRALDDGWRRLAGQDVAPRVRRAYFERPRGHSKTTDMAIQLAWILQNGRDPVSGLAAAADREQAALIRDAVFRVATSNPAYCGDLAFTKFEVRNAVTGSCLQIISSDAQSSYGALVDFIICDELCHWENADLWHSLYSTAAKKRNCILAVLTNAGVGRGWQWDVREMARRSSRWHFSSVEGPAAPWIDEAQLDEQRQLLPPPVFDRLWRNIWQHSDGEFVTLAEVEACRDDALTERRQGRPRVPYFAAVDYAEKRDYTVGVVVHIEGDRVVVDRMDVAVPQPGRPVRVEWVEDWMQQVASDFDGVIFVVDEYQLLGTIQRFEQCFPIERFAFSAGRGNHDLAVTLRRLIVHRRVRWYPDCGGSENLGPGDTLEAELASLLLKQSPSGYCRFTHVADGRHHDDRAFALGAACLLALQHCGGENWMHSTPPSSGGGFDL